MLNSVHTIFEHLSVKSHGRNGWHPILTAKMEARPQNAISTDMMPQAVVCSFRRVKRVTSWDADDFARAEVAIYRRLET